MNDADAIFDAVGKMSRYLILMDRRREKRLQISRLKEKRCGNCSMWMTSYCIPEKKHGILKSCNGISCKDFELKDQSFLLPKFQQELEEIESKISALQRREES